MNTHTDGLFRTTLVKEKTLVNLELAMPAVDQPSKWVDGREVDEGVVFHFPLWLGPQLPRFTFYYAFKQEKQVNTKR